MIYVNSVNVFPKSITLKVGSWSCNNYAEVSPSDASSKEIQWYSDNPSVASVNPSNGYIYANAVGIAKIYATATDNSRCSDFITVTVKNELETQSISLDKTNIAINKGESISLTAKTGSEDISNKSITWSSDNNDIVTVNNGIVTAISNGTARITATVEDNINNTSTCEVTVTDDTLVSCICVNPCCATLDIGASMYLEAIISPSNATNKNVVWRSSNRNIATVNSFSGLVYAQNPGTTEIRAVARDGSGVVGRCTINVSDVICVESIVLSSNRLNLSKGESGKISATVLPENATNKTIRWCSNKPEIAYVNARTGRVTAKSPGRVKIYATAQDCSEVCSYFTVVVKQTSECPTEEEPDNTAKKNTAADPVDVYTGAHKLQNTIMRLFGGQGITFTAHYDSTHLVCGSMGKGWTHNYEKHLVIEGCEAFVYNNPSVFARYKANNDSCTLFNCVSADKNGYILSVDNSALYPYVINCNSARTEYYNTNGYLAKIVDHQGFETLIDHTNELITITDSITGKSIYLEKDSSCKIVRVYDDANRQAILSYENNLLTSICDVNGNSLTYEYDEEKRIKSGIDSMGVRYFENTYDDYGRVLTQKDALNNISYFDYCEDSCCNCAGDTRITTNRNGKKSTRIYDCNGLLISYTDENGNTKRYEYDGRYNIRREVDANNNSVIKTYNSFNKPLSIQDRNGNVTSFTYDSFGNVTQITYPPIGGTSPTETFVYNSRNQIIQHTDIRGTVTLYTYDENGMPASKKVGSKNAMTYSYRLGLLRTETDAMRNRRRYSYNSLGQLASVTDAHRNITRYTYDACGNLINTIDANGKSISTTYDGNYQKTSVTDANGNTTEYSYNGNMKNDIVTLPDGHTIRYEFDNEDRNIKIIDQQNNATSITYDDTGRVISKRLSDGAAIYYEYDAVGNIVKETNPTGAIICKTYDPLGNVLTVTDNEGNTTSYEYNAMSKVTKVTNAVSGTTVYTYSKAGDLLSETDALGNTKTYTYDAYGNRLTATDAKNNVTTYTYDQNNNLLTVRNALGYVTTYTYNAHGQCVSVKDALNNTINYVYDALGRRITVVDARGNVFTTAYDGNGNVIKTTDANGNIISETVYNSLNHPLTVTDAMGKSTTYTYNALGKVESITDPLNHRTEFTYNSRGQNTEVRDAANNVSSATYDMLGNVTRLEGPLGGATNYTYDDMGRVTSESTVSGGTKSYEYNELNICKKITNARGRARRVFYDATGRITGYTSREGPVSYTYDANGNVLTVTNNRGTITRTYDALNRVLSYTDTYGKVIRYEYDAVGNLSKLIYPDNTAVTYAYDANHNLTCVTDWANRVTSYTYDENNRVIGVTKPDGSVTTTVYDNKQRVTSTVERTAGGAVITGFEYIYDDLSRIIEEKILANSTKMCYTYDDLSRVTTRTVKQLTDNSIVSTETFNYDAAGNITDGSAVSTFVYDTNNRLISFNGNDVSYDLDGNMLSNGFLTCTYDSANRLVSAGGHTYTYNAEDVRIRNLYTEEDTTYTYNTNAKLSMLLMKTTNGVVTKYVYGKGLIGEEVSGAFKTYHFDCRGSTIAITDASGNITDTFVYDTYGKLISRTGTNKVIFGYNGRDGVVTDDNGLIYMRARYYSPEIKRFINADIVAGAISNAITLNRFTYANSNPAMNVDPSGLLVGSLIAGAFGLSGLLLGLSGCTSQETPSTSNNNQSSTQNRQSTTNITTPDKQSSTPKITSTRQARALYLSGLISEEDIPPQYSLDPGTRLQYMEQQKKQQDIAKEEEEEQKKSQKSEYEILGDIIDATGYAADVFNPLINKAIVNSIKNEPRPHYLGKGIWLKQINEDVTSINKAFDYLDYGLPIIYTLINTSLDIFVNIENGNSKKELISDAIIDVGAGAVSLTTTYFLAKAGSIISPGWGTVIGLGIGLVYDYFVDKNLDKLIE